MRYLLAFALMCPCGVLAQEKGKPAEKPGSSMQVEVRLVDQSTVKGTWIDDKVDISTRYGKLTVPVAEVQRIEFGLRPGPDQLKIIAAALNDLKSPNEKDQQKGATQLLTTGDLAYPALIKASQSNDPEYAARIRNLLEQMKERFGAGKSEPRDDDVIHTDGFTIVGRMETGPIRLKTNHFGELTLAPANLRSLHTPRVVAEAVNVNALPDPGNLVSYEGQQGKVFHFNVVGAAQGSLWGTEVYTTDSTLAAAAVHMGIVKPGQTGVVKVQIMPSPPNFVGTSQNGITSSGYGTYRASYKVSKP